MKLIPWWECFTGLREIISYDCVVPPGSYYSLPGFKKEREHKIEMKLKLIIISKRSLIKKTKECILRITYDNLISNQQILKKKDKN